MGARRQQQPPTYRACVLPNPISLETHPGHDSDRLTFSIPDPPPARYHNRSHFLRTQLWHRLARSCFGESRTRSLSPALWSHRPCLHPVSFYMRIHTMSSDSGLSSYTSTFLVATSTSATSAVSTCCQTCSSFYFLFFPLNMYLPVRVSGRSRGCFVSTVLERRGIYYIVHFLLSQWLHRQF